MSPDCKDLQPLQWVGFLPSVWLVCESDCIDATGEQAPDHSLKNEVSTMMSILKPRHHGWWLNDWHILKQLPYLPVWLFPSLLIPCAILWYHLSLRDSAGLCAEHMNTKELVSLVTITMKQSSELLAFLSGSLSVCLLLVTWGKMPKSGLPIKVTRPFCEPWAEGRFASAAVTFLFLSLLPHSVWWGLSRSTCKGPWPSPFLPSSQHLVLYTQDTELKWPFLQCGTLLKEDILSVHKIHNYKKTKIFWNVALIPESAL